MIVIVLSSCPTGLRGDLTKWALEVSAGVFVGNVSARVRELLWQRIEETAGTGQALMVWPAQNEQRWQFRTKEHKWEPVDLDGLTFMRRPAPESGYGRKTMQGGWSKARAIRNASKYSKYR